MITEQEDQYIESYYFLFMTSGTFPALPGSFLKNFSQYQEKLHWIIAFKYLRVR